MRIEQKQQVWLVAEDDPDDQLLLRDALEDLGLDVALSFAWDGDELMEILSSLQDNPRKPTLVLLDLNMPRKDGRTTLREIKADPILKSTRVVILTTSQSEEDLALTRSYGADGYYQKPGSFGELRQILAQLFILPGGITTP